MQEGRRDPLTLNRLMLGLDSILQRSCPQNEQADAFDRASRDHKLLLAGVSAIVDACGLSHENVARTCRRRLGVTPTAPVNHARLDQPAHLLASGGTSITHA